MSDINQVKLRGRAGGDAEVKTLPNATLVTVRIATGESYTDRSGSALWATKDRAVCLVIKRLPSDYCHHIRKCGNYHKCQCKQVGPQNSARSRSQSY